VRFPILRRSHLVAGVVVLTLFVLGPAVSSAGKVPLMDDTGASQGKVTTNLKRGLIKLKISGLAPLPALVTTTTETFTATEYRAYLLSSVDPTVEIFLGQIYPNAKQRAKGGVALKGDLSQMGLDRVVVTAFSSDGQHSFDVLTAALSP
jgi:hypothetical protein